VNQAFEHWKDWAATYGSSLRATTKTWTAKALELDALQRRLREIGDVATVLEVGCGNGVNCLELAKVFPTCTFDGVDYVPEMVAVAEDSRCESDAATRLHFFVGDALDLAVVDGLRGSYDVVFTDRCLINLDDTECQKRAISELSSKVRPDGHLIMIENSTSTYAEQNRCRQLLGLPPRVPESFNVFLEEEAIVAHIAAVGLDVVDIEDFSSLHDLALYVLIPSLNGGKVDYGHPFVEAATTLSIGLAASGRAEFGALGQNRLFCCRKRP
jgi:SAM-dependent methyltransferase